MAIVNVERLPGAATDARELSRQRFNRMRELKRLSDSISRTLDTIQDDDYSGMGTVCLMRGIDRLIAAGEFIDSLMAHTAKGYISAEMRYKEITYHGKWGNSCNEQ